MGTALRRRNIIYKAISIVTVGIIVLHGNLNGYIILHSLTVYNLVVKSCFTAVQISDELLDPALVVEILLHKLFPALIPKYNPQSSSQESHLAKTLL